MSQLTDFYMSWLGSGNAFGGQSIRLRDQEPLVFRPTDISGCAMWFDANDNDSVTYDNLLQVTSWSNKGTLGGQFDLSGGIITYGQTTINGLNTISMDTNAFMTGQFELNFQARSVFIVTKANTIPAGIPNPYITSDVSGGMETFSDVSGTTLYFIGKHPSPFPEFAFETTTNYTGVASLTEFINATDLSYNWAGVNGTYYTPIYDADASGYNTSLITYYLGGYFGGSPVASSQDWCEMIIYDTNLSDAQREAVEYYLKIKWNIQEPIPPPAPPFAPTDISGLYIWFDANNLSTITTDLSNNVLTWSNLGLASNVASSNSGAAVLAQDVSANNNYVMVFPSGGTDLATTMTLPYLDRTQFVVFQNIADLSGEAYPFVNFFNSYTNSCMQTGLAWDSNTATYLMEMCQQGQNCPVIGIVPNLNTCNYSVAIFQNVSADYTQNLAYFNGGSNLNTGSNAGNLFLQTNESYTINNATSNAPANVICEMLEYNSALTASNIAQVADYLAIKWALSSFQTIV